MKTDVQNYFIPASIDTVAKLHKSSLELIKRVKELQAEVIEQNNFINTTEFMGLIPQTVVEREENLNAIQQLLNSYTKILTEINKQHESIR